MYFIQRINFILAFSYILISPAFAQTGEISISNIQIDRAIQDRMNVFIQNNSGTLLDSITKKEELLELKKEVLEQWQTKVDWWLTIMGTLITIVTAIASVVFAYNIVSIKKSLKEVQDEASSRIQELKLFAASEKRDLEKIYTERESSLNKEQVAIKQSIAFITEFSIAIWLLWWKRYEEAVAKYESLLKDEYLTNEQKALCLRHLWILYNEKNDLEKSLSFYERSLDLKPDSLGTIIATACILWKQEKYNEALTMIERGLFIDPSDTFLLKIKDSTLSLINKKTTT